MSDSAASEHDRRTYRRGCRCEDCRAANAAYTKQLREGRQKQLSTTPIAHGADGYTNWGCRCEACRRAHAVQVRPSTARWQERNREARTERSTQALRATQAETREKASRNGYQWTGPELELAAREDLSAREVAIMIGRTLAAVQYMRRKLKGDPKTINVAGIAQGTSAGVVRPGEEPTT